MFIEGLGISNYRSFGELQRIGPFGKVNLFIGQNNSGKSNILLFLKNHYKAAISNANLTGSALNFSSLDRHLGDTTGVIKYTFGLSFDGPNCNHILTIGGSGLDTRANGLVKKIFESKTLTQDTPISWFQYEASINSVLTISKDMVIGLRAEEIFPDNEWAYLWNKLTKQGQGDIERHWIPETLNKLSPVHLPHPDISLIPAIRNIGDASSPYDEHDFSGLGIITRLAKLQNPGYAQQELKDRFEQVNQFLRIVTDNSTARLEIPFDRDMILVHMDNKTLPLGSLGTGIHEVVILAAAATILNNQIICIEEPELHLHPLLQKKLIHYLQKSTDNQYFITTHSAHLLDTPNVRVFHIRYQNGQSIVDPAFSDSDKSLICADLGYRASDILQTNCIIWVEGPTDRIYLNHWISKKACNLVEGLHYSIMFYGGRLLSHLTGSDVEVDEFISLRRLNRNMTIIIDSDRSSSHKKLNQTKMRIRSEFDQGPGFAWVTKGREIENYIPIDILEEAVKRLYPDAQRISTPGPYIDIFNNYAKRGNNDILIDKMKLAHEVVKSEPDYSILDLTEKMEKIIGFIRESNDFIG
jgi:energy-coupling factor transporter ATP-binding protein EcfA2